MRLDDWRFRGDCGQPEEVQKIRETKFDPWYDRNGKAYAKKVCGDCPVRHECKAYGLQKKMLDDDGIFGGMTKLERRRFHRQTRAAIAKLEKQMKKLQQGGKFPIAS